MEKRRAAQRNNNFQNKKRGYNLITALASLYILYIKIFNLDSSISDNNSLTLSDALQAVFSLVNVIMEGFTINDKKSDYKAL